MTWEHPEGKLARISAITDEFQQKIRAFELDLERSIIEPGEEELYEALKAALVDMQQFTRGVQSALGRVSKTDH